MTLEDYAELVAGRLRANLALQRQIVAEQAAEIERLRGALLVIASAPVSPQVIKDEALASLDGGDGR